MKKLLWLLCFVPSVVFASPKVTDMPYNAATDGCVDITSYTWVAVPATTRAGRDGVFVSNPSTVTVFGASSNSLAVSSAIAPIMIPGNDSRYFQASDQVLHYFHRIGPSGEVKLCTEEVSHP